jgi:transcriptional regulator with XRE-family HTH domain
MDVQIAHRLVMLRAKQGFSQEELAEKIGVSRQAVSKWERAESSPDTDNLIALAKVYNLKIDDMLYAEDTNKVQENPVNKGDTVGTKNWKDEKAKWKGLPYPIVAVIRIIFLTKELFVSKKQTH